MPRKKPNLARKFFIIYTLLIVVGAAVFAYYYQQSQPPKTAPTEAAPSTPEVVEAPKPEPKETKPAATDPAPAEPPAKPEPPAAASSAEPAKTYIAAGMPDMPLPKALHLRYPEQLIVDVTQPPYNADNTGRSDTTEALLKAFEGIGRSGEYRGKIIYFPKGTYLVSDRLSLDPDARGGWGGTEVRTANMYLIGEQRNETVIRLQDNSPAFANAECPVSLLSYFDGPGSNTAFFNQLRNLTIDVGRGNPGAIAVDFHTNNGGGLEYVTLISRDTEQPAHTGLRMDRRLGGIGLMHELRIVGFRRGVEAAFGRVGYIFNQVELLKQTETAIYNRDKPLWFFNSLIWGAPTALLNDNYTNTSSNGSQTIFVDCRLLGPEGGDTAIDNQVGGQLFIRNTQVAGYQYAVLEADGSRVHPGELADEYINGPVITADRFSEPKSLALEMPAMPEAEWYMPDQVYTIRSADDLPERIEKPDTTWILVDGADSNNADADMESEALQAAINSGAWTVALKGSIDLNRTIDVSGSLRRLFAVRPEFGGNLRLRQPIRHSRSEPAFRLRDTEADMLVIEGVGTNDWPTKAGTLYLNERSQPTLFKDVPAAHMRFYRNAPGATAPAYFVSCWGGPPMPNANFPDEGNWLHSQGQPIYMWLANPEYLEGFHEREPYIKIEDADCIIRGFKFGENTGPYFTIKNGRAELLGGILNSKIRERMSATMIPFTSENAQLSVVAAETHRGWSHKHLLEVRDRAPATRIPASAAPRRQGSDPGGALLPLLIDRR